MIGALTYYIEMKTGADLFDAPKTWTFETEGRICVVKEVENDHDCHAFEVYMILGSGESEAITMQTVIPADAAACDACRASLDEGENPIGAWEDGRGQTVRPENGDILVIGACRIEYPLVLQGADIHGWDTEECCTPEDVRAYLRHPHYGSVRIVTDEDDGSAWVEVPAALCNLRPAEDMDSDADLVEREEY